MPGTPQIVIAMYRPKPGRQADLLALVERHLPTLRAAGLVTARPGVAMRSFADGTIVEVFEWTSLEAAQHAHDHPEVAKLWGAMGQVADFVSLGQLAEASGTFPHFEPVQPALARTR